MPGITLDIAFGDFIIFFINIWPIPKNGLEIDSIFCRMQKSNCNGKMTTIEPVLAGEPFAELNK